MTTIEPCLQRKIDRLARGAPPRVLDLFAGCGGLSLGFHAAGYELVAGIEIDPHAAATYGRNLHGGSPLHSKPRDLTRTSPEELARELDLGDPADAVDVVVGGPPCQAFARIGRAKLREVAKHPEAFLHDPRADLHGRWLAWIAAFRPLAVLVENVPDMLNVRGRNLAEEIAAEMDEMGFICRYTLLNAVHYGVPQVRERLFVLALRRELGLEPVFPTPRYRYDLPRGYEATRRVALHAVVTHGLFASPYWVEAPRPGRKTRLVVTAGRAIGELPVITDLRKGISQRGVRRLDRTIPYVPRKRPSAYVQKLRSWPGFEADSVLRDHVIRHLPRDWPIFAAMDPGEEYPKARERAEDMFRAHVAERIAHGELIMEGSVTWAALHKAIVPPYDPGKFPNKWWKIDPKRPARTLMAHLGKDGYSHIHGDRRQARTISVREAARLQSFPDGFVFSGTMNNAFRQIGNAVPPLLALELAAGLRRLLDTITERPDPVQMAAVA